MSTVRQGGAISPDLVFKSPYFLDFTGLKGYYSEKKLEDMIISGMQQFLMELGNGFSFVDRQKRIIIDGEDFYLDLLFYHRKLHRLVARGRERERRNNDRVRKKQAIIMSERVGEGEEEFPAA